MENKQNDQYNLIDKPIDALGDDRLGIEPYVEALSTVIENCATPMTISIQGNWGTGKTSFMNLVEKKLKEKNGLETVIFNTWQYSKFNMDDMLSVSLLNKFAEAIIPKDRKSKNKDKIKKIIESISFTSLDLLSKGILSKEKITDLFSEGAILSTADQLYELKSLLQKEVDALIKSGKYKRIIVFIDDLDRLKPKNAVELLEVLQLFLTIENCVFVLAVDYEVVTQGIKHKMGAEYSDEKARNFFDKIIQLPFNIPVETNEIVTKYVKGMLSSIPMPEKIQNPDRYVSLLNKSVRFNPRNTKRIINTFWLLRLVAPINNKKGLQIQDFNLSLFAVLCMQISYRRIYINLLTLIDENEDDELESFLNSEITEDTLQEHFIDELSDSNTKCIAFLNEFRKIFMNGENFNLMLLKEVMTLSQSTAEETVQEKQLVAAVVIWGIEAVSFEKIADLLKENFPDVIDTISKLGDSQDAVLVRFKRFVGKSYRIKIKQTLIDNEISHNSVRTHSYDYYAKTI